VIDIGRRARPPERDVKPFRRCPRCLAVAALAVAVMMLACWLSVPGAAAAAPSQQADLVLEGGQGAGGPVRLTLNAGQTTITALEMEGVAGGGCNRPTLDLSNWGGPIEVVDGQFQVTNPDGDVLTGQVVGPGRLEGTVQVRDPARGCETPPLRWVASAPGL